MSGPMRSFRSFLKNGTLNPKYLRELRETESAFGGTAFESWDEPSIAAKPLPRPDEPMQVVSFQRPARTFDVAELVARFGREATMGIDSPKRQEFRSLHQWSKGGIKMSDSRARELGL